MTRILLIVSLAMGIASTSLAHDGCPSSILSASIGLKNLAATQEIIAAMEERRIKNERAARLAAMIGGPGRVLNPDGTLREQDPATPIAIEILAQKIVDFLNNQGISVNEINSWQDIPKEHYEELFGPRHGSNPPHRYRTGPLGSYKPKGKAIDRLIRRIPGMGKMPKGVKVIASEDSIYIGWEEGFSSPPAPMPTR